MNPFGAQNRFLSVHVFVTPWFLAGGSLPYVGEKT